MSTVPLPLARRRLARWASSPDGLQLAMRKTLEYANTRIGAAAIGQYMRDAKGEGRRLRADRGPLRILSGTHAKAVRGSSPASVARIETRGSFGATLRKGVDLSLDPGGYNEEGTRYAPARPTIVPAAQAESSRIRKRAEQLFKRSFVSAIRGVPSRGGTSGGGV